ncbi:transposase [Halobacillus shinanisalinarum]|uniref:transposase n=1 Tax=Halobacillus shinanisalinarum TaxID=2932258 RepID=UPI0037BE9610
MDGYKKNSHAVYDVKRSSRLLQDQFPELKKKYWGQHLWARGYFCVTVGTVDEETIRNYIANQFRIEE